MKILDINNTDPRLQNTKDGGVQAVVYPRIHCFSLDLSEKNGFMKHGAFGFSISDLPITIEAKISAQDIIESNLDISSIDSPVDFSALREYLKVGDAWSVNIKCSNQLVKNHIGIGVSTQIRGGVLLACAKASGRSLNINDLYKLGVGNTSTLGLKLLFRPGMLCEMGLSGNSQLSTMVYSADDFPFFITLAIPKAIVSVSGTMEDTFYDDLLPDSEASTDQIAYEVFERMMPAIVEEDFDLFLDAFTNICNSGTKPAEESIQSEVVVKELSRLRSLFGFAAISSVGPTIYTFSAEDPKMAVKSLSSNSFDYIVLPPQRRKDA